MTDGLSEIDGANGREVECWLAATEIQRERVAFGRFERGHSLVVAFGIADADGVDITAGFAAHDDDIVVRFGTTERSVGNSFVRIDVRDNTELATESVPIVIDEQSVRHFAGIGVEQGISVLLLRHGGGRLLISGLGIGNCHGYNHGDADDDNGDETDSPDGEHLHEFPHVFGTSPIVL